MIQALLHGKLSREQANMEDLLTSCVFGTLRYLPEDEGLLPFLRLAKTVEGETLLAVIPDGAKADYCFWPPLAEKGCLPCEPDVLLTITEPGGKKHLVLIEAKFRSGKSFEADDEKERPNDQLAKEWDNLESLATAEGAEPFLVYLTADFGCPVAQISE